MRVTESVRERGTHTDTHDRKAAFHHKDRVPTAEYYAVILIVCQFEIQCALGCIR